MGLIALFSFSYADDCQKYSKYIEKYTRLYISQDFPYWYAIGQVKTESNCRNVLSKDGHGSIGIAQITPKFWDRELLPLFPDWKNTTSANYFQAYAYILNKSIQSAYCKELWNGFQVYNRNVKKVNREARLSNCSYSLAYQICLTQFSENICVWKKDGVCLQYRTSCDINYTYSRKVYLNGLQYKRGSDLWKFF